MEHLEEARSLCQHFIDKHPSDKMAIAQIRVVLGKTQLLAGNSVQAARTFLLAMREPSMHEPEAFYGLALGRAQGDSAVGAEIARLSSNIATSGEGIRMRIELGKLALGDQDYKRAAYYLTKALRWQPNNITAKVLLGEAFNLALKAGIKTDPVKVFSSVLERDPGNTRARLGLARAHAIKREFALSLQAYEKVLEQDASYDYVAREHARTLFWDQRYTESFNHYKLLIARLPSDYMAVDFFDDPVDNVARQAMSDFESNTEFANAVRLELAAKVNMTWRPPIAQQALEELTIQEPANQEALFDLAQINHRRGLTDDAINHYKDLIKIAGGHQEAVKALAGAQRELVPSLNVTFDNEERNGRDGLSFMDESSAIADTRFSLGNKHDTFGFGLGRRTYAPGGLSDPNSSNAPYYDAVNANVVRFFGSKALGDSTVVDALGELPTYDHNLDDGMSERLYYNAGVTYTSDTQTTVKLRFFSEPVAQNAQTLKNDIYRQGGRVGLETALTRRLDWGISGLIADYSDDNTRVEGNVFAAYEFTTAPTELRVLIKADFIDSSKEMLVIDENTTLANYNPTTDTEVPYFSPNGYSVFSLQTNWQHQLGKEWFTGADDMFYKVSVGFAVDSNSVAYTEFGMGGGYDITDWLRMEIGLRMVRSSAIDITSGFGMITVRWP
jgi:tetratricopeptide (TPR) repeat protein